MARVNSVSEKIRNYIIENKLSTDQISKETGVSKEKLINRKSILNASEFLEICSYLNIRPEDLRRDE